LHHFNKNKFPKLQLVSNKASSATQLLKRNLTLEIFDFCSQ